MGMVRRTHISYPVRNFRCPFCGTKMPTEEYKGWTPWKCPGCSAELQFSEAHGLILQVCFVGLALLLLYLLGLRGWELAVGAVLLGFALAVVFGAPFDRILPRRLELYRPPPWKEDKRVSLFSREHADADNCKQADQPPDEPPKGA